MVGPYCEFWSSQVHVEVLHCFDDGQEFSPSRAISLLRRVERLSVIEDDSLLRLALVVDLNLAEYRAVRKVADVSVQDVLAFSAWVRQDRCFSERSPQYVE